MFVQPNMYLASTAKPEFRPRVHMPMRCCNCWIQLELPINELHTKPGSQGTEATYKLSAPGGQLCTLTMLVEQQHSSVILLVISFFFHTPLLLHRMNGSSIKVHPLLPCRDMHWSQWWAIAPNCWDRHLQTRLNNSESFSLHPKRK